MNKIFRQGDLNGLCGLYAIVNAIQRHLEVRFHEDFTSQLFIALCKKIKKQEFPEFLWEGFDVSAFLRLSRAAAEHIDRKYGFLIEVFRPFVRSNIKDSNFLLGEIEKIWDSQPTTVAMSVQWPNDEVGHWTVLDWISESEIGFRDSIYTKPIERNDLSCSSSAKHLIVPSEIVAFRLKSINGELCNRKTKIAI